LSAGLLAGPCEVLTSASAVEGAVSVVVHVGDEERRMGQLNLPSATE
jgi:hypothetical protein